LERGGKQRATPRLRAEKHPAFFVALCPKAVSPLRFATAVQNAGAHYGAFLEQT
jgi:hypothetical protein